MYEPERGNFCLLDAELAALPGLSKVVTADPLKILPMEEHGRVTFGHLVKPKCD